jgi:hypothetical protein
MSSMLRSGAGGGGDGGGDDGAAARLDEEVDVDGLVAACDGAEVGGMSAGEAEAAGSVEGEGARAGDWLAPHAAKENNPNITAPAARFKCEQACMGRL